MTLEMNKYLQVRKAQAQGVRTIEELKEISDIAIENEEEALIKSGCKYNFHCEKQYYSKSKGDPNPNGNWNEY